jgi:hypothetical protein
MAVRFLSVESSPACYSTRRHCHHSDFIRWIQLPRRHRADVHFLLLRPSAVCKGGDIMYDCVCMLTQFHFFLMINYGRCLVSYCMELLCILCIYRVWMTCLLSRQWGQGVAVHFQAYPVHYLYDDDWQNWSTKISVRASWSRWLVLSLCGNSSSLCISEWFPTLKGEAVCWLELYNEWWDI